MMRLSILLALLLPACISQEAEPNARLPFHVAVIPVESKALNGLPAAGEEVADVDLQIQLDSTVVSQQIVTQLEEQCFAKVSLLNPPGNHTLNTFARQPAADQMAHWRSQAEQVEADLVLQLVLRYEPRIPNEINGFMFFLNFLTFSLGGPFCWWTDDRSYDLGATLTARLYDLNTPTDPLHSFPRGAQLAEFDSLAPSLDLDFVDRAGGSWVYYGVSFLIPSGLLASESDGTREQLELEASEGLASDLVTRLWDREQEIIVASRMTNFFLDPAEWQVVRASPEEVLLKGDIILKKDASVDGLDSFAVNTSSTSPWVEEGFAEGTRDDQLSTETEEYYRFHLARVIPMQPGAQTVQFRVRDAGRNSKSRTYTIPILSAGSSGQALAWERRRRTR
jgi:hypothetical protein